MDDTRLENKLDHITETIGQINTTLAVNTKQLELHMLRTAQNEVMISKLDAKIEPLKKHAAMVDGGMKLLGFLSLLLGIGAAIVKILSAF